MQNFLNFLIRSWYLLLFIVLNGLCFALLINYNKFQKASYFNSAGVVTGRIYETRANFTDYLYLKDANEALALENARLRAMLPQSYERTVKRFFIKEDTVFRQKYSFTEAKVVNNTTDKRNNIITLNKGSVHGINRGMGVITSNGIVGVVRDVSTNYSTVLSFLHKAVKVSAKLKKDDNVGSFIWEGGSPLYGYLKDISQFVKIKKGDTIVTTEFSSFPEGIMVGQVESLEEKPGDAFHNIKVKLSTDFKRLTYVYVVDDLTRAERDTLETKTITETDKQ